MIGPLKNLLGGKKEDEKQGKYFVEFDDAAAESASGTAPASTDSTEGEADKKPAPKTVEKKEQKSPKKKAVKGKADKQSKKAVKGKADKQSKEEVEPADNGGAKPEMPPAPPQPAALFSPYNRIPRFDGKRRGPGPSLDMFKEMAKDMGR